MGRLSGAQWLCDFVRESNRIEGIHTTTQAHVDAHAAFLVLDRVTVEDLVCFVGVVQPNARLRDKETVPGVRVGNHIAPPSGPEIRANLEIYLWGMDRSDPFKTHCSYETLHPFTDGNGRSGRLLWLWHMLHLGSEMPQALGFLHTWYYQSLAAIPSRAALKDG